MARQVLKLSGAEASQQIARLLAIPTTNRPHSERRRLSALFMAAGNPVSAVVQWLRLPKTERISADGLTAELVAQLEKRSLQMNENVSIAAALAVQLGHEQVYPVDDHTGDAAIGQMDEKVFEQEIRQIWNNEWTKQRAALLEQQHKHFVENKEASVLEWYSSTNSVEEARRAVAGDFAAAAGAQVPGNTGRKYLAYWETRNMRMVANIRETIGAGSKSIGHCGFITQGLLRALSGRQQRLKHCRHPPAVTVTTIKNRSAASKDWVTSHLLNTSAILLIKGSREASFLCCFSKRPTCYKACIYIQYRQLNYCFTDPVKALPHKASTKVKLTAS